MSIILLILLLIFGGLPVVYLFFDKRNGTFLLASPPILLATWSILLGLSFVSDATTGALWSAFWLGNIFLFILGLYVGFTRAGIQSLALLIAPAFLSLILLGPYVLFGFDNFPGSWFWDGWSYVAGGSSLWSIPLRVEAPASASAINWFGHTTIAASRFIGSALLSVMSGIFPLRGDEQAATGFVLFSGIFAYVSACGFLGAQIFAKPTQQVLFMILSGFSGAALNLVFANNFDHLLALSFGPLLTGIAISFQWNRGAEAALFGALVGGLGYVYPELSPVLALPALATIGWRAWRERPSLRRTLKWLGIACGVLLIVLGPNLVHIYHFFMWQFRASTVIPKGSRPGDYYYPLNICTIEVLVNLYRPFAQCLRSSVDYFKEIVAMLILAAAVAGVTRMARGSSGVKWAPPILLSVGVIAALALWAGAFIQYS